MTICDDLTAAGNRDLEERLCSLAAGVAALTYQFLSAVAEYDRREGWAEWECHDMAGWLSWKCGIAAGTARDQVRVARALPGLPLVSEEFAQGRLSYSQVRAITRVASGDTEQALIELAHGATASELESICRAYRKSRRAMDDAVARGRRRRVLHVGWDDEGNLIGRFSLPADVGAVVASALTGSVERKAVEDAEDEGARDPWGAAAADAFAELIEAGAKALARDEDDDSDRRYLLTVIADAPALAHPAGPHNEPDRGVTCQVQDGPGLATETARRVACDSDVVTVRQDDEGQVLDIGRRTRKINRPLRRALRQRDGHCQFPSCNRRRVQGHHIQHWIDGGPTNLSNLVSLCARHHHRLHEGGFRVVMEPGGRPSFFRPDGEQVMTDPAKDLVVAVAPFVHPYESGWDGSRADLPWIVECLLQADGMLSSEAWTASETGLDVSAETSEVPLRASVS